jgi:hypothetical protein
MRTILYTPLVHCPCAFESEGYCCITKCTEQSNERCIDLIFDLERYLMIPQVTIQEAQETASGRGVHNLVNSGQAKQIFFVGMVEISIINTYHLIFILFWYKYWIG